MEWLPQTSCLFTHETLQTTPSYRQPGQQQRDRHYHQCTDTMVRNAKGYKGYKDKESAVNKHLNSCYDITYLDAKSNKELTEFVLTNTKIIDSSRNWNLLLYKEALHIKRRKPMLNNGLKASRELQLFN